jgi:hypothetical protein
VESCLLYPRTEPGTLFVSDTKSLKDYDRQIIAHWQPNLGFSFIPPSRQQQEASQPWREEHNGLAWLSKL